jgi:hypothetical protein
VLLNAHTGAASAIVTVLEGSSIAAWSSVLDRRGGDAAFFTARQLSSLTDGITSSIGAAISADGATGEVWRTALTLTNGGSEPAIVTLHFKTQTKEIVVPPGAQSSSEDLLLDYFAVRSAFGALTIESTAAVGAALEVVSLRNDVERRENFPLSQDAPHFPAVFPLAARADGFRANGGMINAGASDATVAFQLRGASGEIISTQFALAMAGEAISVPLLQLPDTAASVTILPFEESSQLVPYASSIDALDSIIQAGSFP